MEQKRNICSIAFDICMEWKNIHYSARPYLAVLLKLNTINDVYGDDDARTVIRYALSNMTFFRGERAKELKEELKNHLSC